MDGADQPNQPGSAAPPPPPPPVMPVPPQPQAAPAPEPEIITPHSIAAPPTGPDGSITWTASEYIAHHKSPGWYGALGGIAVVVAAVIWFFTKDIISAAVVIVAAIAFGGYGARQPRQLRYSLDNHGLTIGERRFVYQQFRSFSMVPEGAFASIVFVPLKRFSPLTTIYYDPADEAKIVALLSDRLPHEERQQAMIDRLMWRIRF